MSPRNTTGLAASTACSGPFPAAAISTSSAKPKVASRFNEANESATAITAAAAAELADHPQRAARSREVAAALDQGRHAQQHQQASGDDGGMPGGTDRPH